jgi:hypothetical protein
VAEQNVLGLQEVEYVRFYMEGWHWVDYGGACRGCRGRSRVGNGLCRRSKTTGGLNEV